MGSPREVYGVLGGHAQACFAGASCFQQGGVGGAGEVDRCARVEVVAAKQDDGELVAADATGDAVVAEPVADQTGCPLEDLIARQVSELVVCLLSALSPDERRSVLEAYGAGEFDGDVTGFTRPRRSICSRSRARPGGGRLYVACQLLRYAPASARHDSVTAL